MKDGVPLTQSASVTAIIHNTTSAVFRSEYVLTTVSPSDSGTYTCTVTNPIGSDSETITVIVNGRILMHNYLPIMCL